MTRKDPIPPGKKPVHKSPSADDEPTIRIDSSMADDLPDGPGYVVRPREQAGHTTDALPGLTEEIPEVEDVVVLLEDDGPGSGFDRDRYAAPAEQVPLLRSNPSHPDTEHVHATEMLPVDQFPQIESVEDITSLISDAESVQLKAPTMPVHLDLPVEPLPARERSRLFPAMAIAATLLIAAGGLYFANEQFGLFGGGEKPHHTGRRETPAVTKGQDSPGAQKADATRRFRAWAKGALAVHLGAPGKPR